MENLQGKFLKKSLIQKQNHFLVDIKKLEYFCLESFQKLERIIRKEKVEKANLLKLLHLNKHEFQRSFRSNDRIIRGRFRCLGASKAFNELHLSEIRFYSTS